MALFHAYSQTVADGTATSVVRPSDWNSGHVQQMTLSGNTSGVSTVSGTNIVFQGGDNITLSAAQGAGVATVVISAPNPGGGGAAVSESFFQPEMYGGTALINNANGSMLFRPFELEGYADFDRFLFQVSASGRQANLTLTGSASNVNNTSGNGSFGMTGTVALFTRSNTVEGNASSSSIRSYYSVTTTYSQGFTVSQSQSTNAGSATVSYTTTAGVAFLKNIDTLGGVTYSTVTSSGSGSFSSNSTAAGSFSSSFSLNTFNSMFSGVRPWHAPGPTSAIPPGEYWIGAQISSAGGSTGIVSADRAASLTTHAFVHFTASTNNYLELGNVANMSTSNWRPGYGSFSGTASTTGAVALSQITTMASNASLYFAGIGHGI